MVQYELIKDMDDTEWTLDSWDEILNLAKEAPGEFIIFVEAGKEEKDG